MEAITCCDCDRTICALDCNYMNPVFHWFLSLHSPEIVGTDFSVINTFNAISVLLLRSAHPPRSTVPFLHTRLCVWEHAHGLTWSLNCIKHQALRRQSREKQKSYNLWSVAMAEMVSYHFYQRSWLLFYSLQIINSFIIIIIMTSIRSFVMVSKLCSRRL